MTVMDKNNRVWAHHLSIVLQLGLTMAGCICFCFFIGLYLDRRFDTGGIFITLFIVFGVAGGANVAYRQLMETFQEPEGTGQPRNGGAD